MKKFKLVLVLFAVIFHLFGIVACEKEKIVYLVENKYFESATFKKFSAVSVGVNGNQPSGRTYYIYVYSKCSVSLIEYSVDVKLYDGDSQLLFSFEEKDENKRDKNTNLTVACEISESVYINLDYIEVDYAGKSNENPED